jgi:predicted PurR-regulated permease PerM
MGKIPKVQQEPPPDRLKADQVAPDSAQARKKPEQVALMGIFVLAVLYTIYFARLFLVPIALSLVLAILLSPFVRMLSRIKVPRPIGAGIVVGLLILVVTTTIYNLSTPAAKWMDSVPFLLSNIQFKMSEFQSSLKKVREASRQLEEMANLGKKKQEEVQVAKISLAEKIFTQVRSFSSSALIMVVVLYFILAYGARIQKRLASFDGLPSSSGKIYHFFIQVEKELSSYLYTITIINLCLGLLTAAGLTFVGLPNPFLWGVLACLFNFIPYLGAAFTLFVISIVSLMTFDSWSLIIRAPLVFFFLTALEGQIVTPSILGHRLTINPLVVLVSIFFWGWLWGVAGAILGVPILATFMVAAKIYKPLQPLGRILS